MSSGISKATFEDLEAGYGTFEVQYNPKEFKVDKKVAWKEVEEQGKGKSPLEFQKGSPRTITMELFFDTTHEESPTSVYDSWVKHLLAMTNVNTSASDGGSSDKKRPASVTFKWGNFELTGVVESITTTYTMFSSGGNPIRAKCQVKMKEWEPADFKFEESGSRSGFMYGELDLSSGFYDPTNTESRPYQEGSSPKVVTTTAGQTPQDVANENNTTAQQICVLNNIDDPLFEFSGEDIIVIPDTGALSGGGDDFDWLDFLVDLAVDTATDAAGDLF